MSDPLDVPWTEFRCEDCGKPWNSINAATECCRD